MSVRDLVRKDKFDKLTAEDFGLVLSLVSDQGLREKALKAVRSLIERSSGKEATIMSNTLLTFISSKPDGATDLIALVPLAVKKAPETAAYAVSTLTQLLDDNSLRMRAIDAILEISKDFPQAARLAVYRIKAMGIEDPRIDSLGESAILTKGISAKHKYVDFTDAFTTRESLRKVFKLLDLGPSYPLADAVVATATVRPDALVDFLADLVRLIDKYSSTLPDISIRLLDALELVKVPDLEIYVEPLKETVKKAKTEELRRRLESFLARVQPKK